jgi:hypothetical protein
MNYLLYASNEMFSSTELVRKSKKIFDKLAKKEINKAVILRDGKPNFVMLDFAFYEKIMDEYMMLKENLNTNGNFKNTTTDIPLNKENDVTNISNKLDKIDKEIEEIEDELEDELFEEQYEDEDFASLDDFEINDKPNDSILNEFLEEHHSPEIQKEEETETLVEINTTNNTNDNADNNTNNINIVDDMSEKERLELIKKEEEELKKTLEALESLNLSSSHKKEAKEEFLKQKNGKLKEYYE